MSSRILEAKAVLSAEDKGFSTTLDKIAKKIDQVGKAGKSSVEIDRFAKSLQNAEKHLKAIEKLKLQQGAFADARTKFRQTQVAVEQAARALATADRPTRQLEASLKKAQAAVSSASRAFDKQKDALISAKRAVEAFGTPLNKVASAQDRLKASISSATAAIERQMIAERKAALLAEANAKRQQAAASRRQARGDAAAAVAGIAAGHYGREFAWNAITSAADFDIGVRRQRAYAGISAEDQRNILIPQAMKIGQETQFSNLDIVESQTAVMQRLPEYLPRAQVAKGITDEVKNYAMAMRADMKTSAEAITAYLMSTGKDVSTQDKALQAARKTTNMLIRTAKLGGLDDEDLRALTRFGASSAHIAGFSDESLGAFGIGMKRSGINGDQAGVAMRTIASKLVSPTKKGRAALASLNIDYDDYSSMPGGLSVESFETKFQQEFGKSLSDRQRAKLEALFNDEDIVSDRGAFTEEVSKVVGGSFKRNKKGKLSAKDENAIAKSVGEFHSLSVGGVDVERLFLDILKKDPSLAVLNAIFTDKHGGKVGAISGLVENFLRDREQLGNVPDDYGKKISDEIMGGLGGSLERLKGSFENVTQTVGTANERWLSYSFESVGNLLDGFSNLSDGVKIATTAVAGAGAAFAMFKGAQGFLNGFGLGTSAVALNESAAALTAAAMRLGAGGAIGQAAGGATGAVTSAATTAASGLGTRFAAGFRVGGILAPILALREAAEINNPTTPLGHPYRNDIAIDAGQWERAHRATQEWRRDPEGARGRAWMQMGSRGWEEASAPAAFSVRSIPSMIRDGGQQEPISVTGEAMVHFQPIEVKITGIDGIDARIEQKATAAAQRIIFRNGPGSTGTSSPDVGN